MFEDFDAYAAAGRELADLHVGYEEAEPYAAEVVLTSTISDPAKLYRVEKLRFGPGRDRSTIVINADLTLAGIPERAFDYEVNGRSAVEWVMDRYQVRTDRDSGIRNDPNTYSEDPRYSVDLLLRVVTVSLKTQDVVDRLRDAESGSISSTAPATLGSARHG